jgi:hypothetical protein
LALIVLCLAGAAVLTLLTRGAKPAAALAEQLSFVVQRVPFEAQNALRGDNSAFDALSKSTAQLKTLREFRRRCQGGRRSRLDQAQ